jgi:hypothetical protein
MLTLETAIPVYNYHWLCQKMKDRGRVCIRCNVGGHNVQLYGIINGMRPEDGSGRHWLVTIYDNGNSSEVYVRAE